MVKRKPIEAVICIKTEIGLRYLKNKRMEFFCADTFCIKQSVKKLLLNMLWKNIFNLI